MGYNGSAELFAEWAVGLLIIAVRIYARWSVGKKNFYWDDLCLGFVTIFWTFHTVFLYLCTDVYASNIGLNEETAAQVPDDQVEFLRKGSIFAFIAWLSYIFMVWSFKAVLLFLYSRLTMGFWQHRLLIGVSIASICTFLASFIFHLAICSPVHRSWQIKPYAGDNCTIRPLNYIIIEVLSIVTDMAIMTIPFPLILAARIAKSQKIILCLLFSSGIFVMIAGALRAYYSVKEIDHLSTALGWASREALVSVVIVCAPGIKPLFSKIGFFRSNGSSNRYKNTWRSKSTFHSKGKEGITALSRTGERHPYELAAMGRKKTRRDSSGESQEYIINAEATEKRGDTPEDGIVVTTDVTLAHEDNSRH
ncbi:uncharacterized protein BDV17DRAFT_299478 [Aspergillus undulatus]|uniref:uncharacterized protein n=1 Tax=Aspergillus undulatus TaxID=1810928 RepID=UPI003CCE1A23